MIYALSMRREKIDTDHLEERVLLPTHFGTINSLSIAELALISSRTRNVGIDELLEEQSFYFQQDKKNLLSLVRVVDACRAVGLRCLIRPHPSENTKFYEIFLEKYPGIVEIDMGEYPILNSISRSLTIVSSSCTSLIEGALSGGRIVCLGADREWYLSSAAISVVSEHEFVNNIRGESIVNFHELRRELFLEGRDASRGLDLWEAFFESFGINADKPKIASIAFPNLPLDPYMKRRIGAFSGSLISSYFNKDFGDSGGLLDVRGNEHVVVVSAKV